MSAMSDGLTLENRKCANCGDVTTITRVPFDNFAEYWCDPCRIEGKIIEPPEPCDLCPEGIAIHLVISNWRQKTFSVCEPCSQDLYAETETHRRKLGLDNDSEV